MAKLWSLWWWQSLIWFMTMHLLYCDIYVTLLNRVMRVRHWEGGTWEAQADKVVIFGCFNERQQAQLLPRVQVCNTGRVIKNIEIAKPPSTSSSHSRAQVKANMLAVTLPVSGPRLIFFIFSSNRVRFFYNILYQMIIWIAVLSNL